jgi:carbonic anhydrase/acetyltransferase-like protein (isoleucine patch superfamily)
MIIEYKGKKPQISPSAFIAPTAVIGTLTVNWFITASPRWTVTPEPNVATYH